MGEGGAVHSKTKGGKKGEQGRPGGRGWNKGEVEGRRRGGYS